MDSHGLGSRAVDGRWAVGLPPRSWLVSRKDPAVVDHAETLELSLGERLMVCRHQLRLPADEIALRTGIPAQTYRFMEQDAPGADRLLSVLVDRLPILQAIFRPATAPLHLLHAAAPLREAIRAMERLERERRAVALTRIRLEVDWWDGGQVA